MGIIHVLDSHLTNMIAAGEVVDRPVNIVKECVENSLDAGASTIDIEVFSGGIEGVIISDDGCGMSREDLRMAFRRHATSKIQNEDELFAISTMGFRGEALPSIASVAKVSALTSNGQESSRIVFEYGELKAWEKADAPRGCRIEVRGLFLHTPARFKYLKKPNYEFSIIADAVNKLALAHPEVRFTLKHDGRLVFQTSGRNDRREILYQMFGSQAAKEAVEFCRSGQDFTISGFAIQPGISRASKNYIYVCLNGRTIRSWPVTKAVIEGYREYLPKDRFPICFVNITTDYQLIDVNVHPNKLEVRISKEEYLTQLIIETISELFETEIQAPQIKARKPQIEQLQAEFQYPSKAHENPSAAGQTGRVEEVWQLWPGEGSPQLTEQQRARFEQRRSSPQYPAGQKMLQPNRPEQLFKNQPQNGFPEPDRNNQKPGNGQASEIQKSFRNSDMPEFLKRDLEMPVFKEDIPSDQKKSENHISSLGQNQKNLEALQTGFVPDSSYETGSDRKGNNEANSISQTGKMDVQSDSQASVCNHEHQGMDARNPGFAGQKERLEEEAQAEKKADGANGKSTMPNALSSCPRDGLPGETGYLEKSDQPAGPECFAAAQSGPGYPTGHKPAASRSRGNEFFLHLKIIGQLKDSYILCEGDDGLVIIDQHAAAERCNFEKIQREFEKPVQVMQPLMIPHRMALSADLMAQLDSINEKTTPYGLKFEAFSQNSVLLREEPAWLSLLDRDKFLDDLFTWFKEHRDVDMKELRRHLIATCACHSSVRFHHSLCREEMEQILADLAAADQPYHCPHGRPTVVTMSLRELAKEFERV